MNQPPYSHTVPREERILIRAEILYVRIYSLRELSENLREKELEKRAERTETRKEFEGREMVEAHRVTLGQCIWPHCKPH